MSTVAAGTVAGAVSAGYADAACVVHKCCWCWCNVVAVLVVDLYCCCTVCVCR